MTIFSLKELNPFLTTGHLNLFDSWDNYFTSPLPSVAIEQQLHNPKNRPSLPNQGKVFKPKELSNQPPVCNTFSARQKSQLEFLKTNIRLLLPKSYTKQCVKSIYFLDKYFYRRYCVYYFLISFCKTDSLVIHLDSFKTHFKLQNPFGSIVINKNQNRNKSVLLFQVSGSVQWYIETIKLRALSCQFKPLF